MSNRLDGQVALVTGGTDGIGRETALRLAQLGAEVILVGRNLTKGQAVIDEIKSLAPSSKAQFRQADFSLMQSVQRTANDLRADYKQLDMLVHCAGLTLRKRTLTREGLETVFAIQFLARLLLTQSLIDLLSASPKGRVVDVSAGGTIDIPFDFDNLQGEKHYDGVFALRHESVANDMLILELQERYPVVSFYCYGPGYVTTTLMRDMPAVFRLFAATFGYFISISPGQAADDIVSLLSGERKGGLYTRKGKPSTPSAFKADPVNRSRLWQISENLIANALTKV